MNETFDAFTRRRRALTIASLGLSALALVACGSEDEKAATATEEPTAPVEQTVATGEPTEAGEATQVATAAVSAATAEAGVIQPETASPAATPAMIMEEATPIGAIATPAEEMLATPAASPAMALEAATPIGAIATPPTEVVEAASPIASPVASPVSESPEAAGDTGTTGDIEIPVVIFGGN